MPSIITRLQHGWNAFMGRDPTPKQQTYIDYGYGSYYRPDKARMYRGTDKSIITDVICRIAVDAAQLDIRHVRLDYNKRYIDDVDSKLNNALTVEANVDQTGRAFIQDLVYSMCDEGVVAIVPTDTTSNPITGSYDVETLRVGKITEWYPKHVRIEVYNENSGKREQITLPKSVVGIVENPLYSVMNEPNSTLRRLKRTLNNLDVLDDQNASGKLDLIIQLPYVVKSETRKKQANERRKEIEMQLTGSKYGIAYTDGTERITQLNRPIENNYWNQAKELTSMLYNQLGLTQGVFDGTADERTMTNYYNRTIEPILSAITEEMIRKFLTKNARTRGESIKFFRDPFKLVTMENIANVAATFKTNEIASSNEIRTLIGWKPSEDQKADELRNSNIVQPTESASEEAASPEETLDEGEPLSNYSLSPEEADNLIGQLENELKELYAIRDGTIKNKETKSKEEAN